MKLGEKLISYSTSSNYKVAVGYYIGEKDGFKLASMDSVRGWSGSIVSNGSGIVGIIKGC